MASSDGIVKDPSELENTDGLLEIKCPFLAESTCLMDVCKDKKQILLPSLEQGLLSLPQA